MSELSQLMLYHDLTLSVVAALEAKDTYTADHSLRVSDMTEQICCLLDLPEAASMKIHMAAHVHDIGKIGVPDDILQKKTCLNAQEWVVMRNHSGIGANILNKSQGLAEIADIVLHHHERWDGSGYPAGFVGSAIPQGSRIIAVCDSIDAMMSHRAYRSHILTEEECRLEIEKNQGVMYDPFIAELVLKNWRKIMDAIHRSSNKQKTA